MKTHLKLFALIILLLAACQIPFATAPTATPVPTETAPVVATEPAPPTEVATETSSVPESTATSAPMPASVLDACPPDAQEPAMRAGNVPDWQALGLSACYDLSLELENDTTYTGRARVTYRNDTGSELSDLVFRLFPNADIVYGGSLRLTDVSVDGQPAATELFLSDETAVRLTLPEVLPPGDIAVVDMTLEGDMTQDLGSPETYGILNLSETQNGPVMTLANWYPLLALRENGEWYAAPVVGEGDAVVSEIALYRVTITAPAGWHVVTTGTTIETADVDGATQHTIVTGPVRDFTVAASPAYERLETTVDNVRVVHWGLPDGDDAWEETLNVAVDSVRIFNDRFGPYPYAELDVAAIPMQNAAGVEYPGLALVESGLYTSNQGRNFLPIATAHEVAHMWWYAVVGNDVLRNPWQDEALTTFSSFLYFEEERPTRYEQLVDSYERTVEQFEEEEGVEPITRPLEEYRGRSNAYAVVVYLKGALFFDAMRDRLGDDTFFAALQQYYSVYKYDLAPPEALLASFEDACGCELDDFYDEWGVTPDGG